MVCPSAGALATAAAAVIPPAPGRFSTTNGLPKESVSFWATARVTISPRPPGPKPTTILTGRVGNSCAAAMPAAPTASSAPNNQRPTRSIGIDLPAIRRERRLGHQLGLLAGQIAGLG